MYNLPQAVWQSWIFFLLLAGVPSVARVNKQDHDSCIISGHHIPKGAEKPSKKLVGISHEYCPTPINGEKGCKVHSIQTFTHTSCHEKIRGEGKYGVLVTHNTLSFSWCKKCYKVQFRMNTTYTSCYPCYTGMDIL